MISIHALREEGDLDVSFVGLFEYDFYPRPPRGGRPRAGHITAHFGNISIHALREEGDNPASWLNAKGYIFLSTPSARRATRLDVRGALAEYIKISIHALREEGDAHCKRSADRSR